MENKPISIQFKQTVTDALEARALAEGAIVSKIVDRAVMQYLFPNGSSDAETTCVNTSSAFQKEAEIDPVATLKAIIDEMAAIRKAQSDFLETLDKVFMVRNRQNDWLKAVDRLNSKTGE